MGSNDDTRPSADGRRNSPASSSSLHDKRVRV